MLEFIKKNKNEICLSLILGLFCILGMFDFYNSNAIAYIESNFSFALSNMGIVAGLKIICGILPLSDGISDILDKIFNFFFLANLLIGIEYVLLLVNKIFIFKILLIVFFVLHLMPRLRSMATKILIILLFFNPGLNIYVNLIKIISDEANMHLESEIDKEILSIKKQLGIVTPPNINLEFNDSRSTTQKIIGEIGLFSQKVDKAVDIVTSPIDSTKSAIEFSKDKILKNLSTLAASFNVALKLSVQYILNIFFLYFLMPVVYFYVLYRVISSRP